MSNQQETTPTPKTPTTPTPTSGARQSTGSGKTTGGASQIKAGLRGHDFATQEAMLAPDAGPPGDPVGDGSSGTPSDLPFRSELEASFGMDLGHIKVFLGQPGPLLAIGARALTRGTTIVFADTNPDKTLVAEEVAHVVQNTKGRSSKPYSTNADGSEKRAKSAAKKAASGEVVGADEVGVADAEVQAFWGTPAQTQTAKKPEFAPAAWAAEKKGDTKSTHAPVKPVMMDTWHGTYALFERGPWDDYQQALKDTHDAAVASATTPEKNPPPLVLKDWGSFDPERDGGRKDGMKADDFVAMQVKLECIRTDVAAHIAAMLEKVKDPRAAIDGLSDLKAKVFGGRAAGLPQRVRPDSSETVVGGFALQSLILPDAPHHAEIFGAPIFAAHPDISLALAKLIDPVEDLKAAFLAQQGDTAKCMDVVLDWAIRYPQHRSRALADADVRLMLGLQNASVWSAVPLTVDAGQFGRMLKILATGEFAGDSPEDVMQRALVTGDAPGFEAAWLRLMRDRDTFLKYAQDASFISEVRRNVPTAVDAFLISLKAGPLEANEDGWLNPAEKLLVEKLSANCMGQLFDWLSSLWSTRLTADSDRQIVALLTRWNQNVTEALAADNASDNARAALDAKLAAARKVFRDLWQAAHGKAIGVELSKTLYEPHASEARKLLDATESASAEKPGEIAGGSGDGNPRILWDGNLSGEVKDALKTNIFLRSATELYKEFSRYSPVNAVIGGGTNGATVVDTLRQARTAARDWFQENYAPETIDMPAMQRQAMLHLTEIYNDSYASGGDGPGLEAKSSLRVRITRELQGGFQQQALEMIGASPAPVQDYIDSVPSSGTDKDLSSGKALQDLAVAARRVVAVFHEEVNSGKAVELAPAQVLHFTATRFANEQRNQASGYVPEVFEKHWRPVFRAVFDGMYGSLGHFIARAYRTAPDRGNEVTEGFGLGHISNFTVGADADMVHALETLRAAEKSGPPDAKADGQNSDAPAASNNTKLADALEKQIPVRQRLTHTAGLLFRALEDKTRPQRTEPIMTRLKALVEEPGSRDKPLEVLDPNRIKAGEPSVRELEEPPLFQFVYQQCHGVDVIQHVGHTVANGPPRADAESILGVKLPAFVSASKGDESILGNPEELSKIANTLQIDETRLHAHLRSQKAGDPDGAAAWLRHAAASVRDLKAKLDLVESQGTFYMAHARRELMVALGKLGTGEERRLANALFEAAYGYSIKYQLARMDTEGGGTDGLVLQRLADGRQTPLDAIRGAVEAKDRDELMALLQKASDTLRSEIRKDGALREQIAEKLGTEVLGMAMRLCEGGADLGGMLLGRDWQAANGSAFSQTVSKMGWGTDEAGMKKDIKLHLEGLKARIVDEKTRFVTTDSLTLSQILQKFNRPEAEVAVLVETNRAALGSRDLAEVLPKGLKLKLPADWVKSEIADTLAREWLSLVNDPDVRSILKEQLSEKDRLEMEAMLLGGGKASVRDDISMKLEASDGEGVLATLRTMDAAKRKALLADGKYLAKLATTLESAHYECAIGILTGTGNGKLDVLASLKSESWWLFWKDHDEQAIVDAIAGLSSDELEKLVAEPLLVARIRSALGASSSLDNLLMSGSKNGLGIQGLLRPSGSGNGQGRDAIIAREKQRIVLRYVARFEALLMDSDIEKLWDLAGEIYREEGEVEVPVATSPTTSSDAATDAKEKVKVFSLVEREQVHLALKDTLNLKELNGLSIVGSLRSAILRQLDPVGNRLAMAAKGQNQGKSIDAAKAAIAAAADATVARYMSNIVEPGPDGRALKRYYEAFVQARAQHAAISSAKNPDAAAVATSSNRLRLALTALKVFPLDISQSVANLIELGPLANVNAPPGIGMFHGFGQKDALTLRNALRDRIASLPKTAVAAAMGIDVEKLAPEASGDLDILMGEDRTARMGRTKAEDEYQHASSDGAIGQWFGRDELNKATHHFAQYNASLDRAEERKEGEDVTTVDGDEAKLLSAQLAKVGASLKEYHDAKKAAADMVKTWVGVVIGTVATIMTGGTAAPLWATLLQAGISATANVLIDELIRGNDYEMLAEGLPSILAEVGSELLWHSLGVGMTHIAAQDTKVGKIASGMLKMHEKVEKLKKQGGPLESALGAGLLAAGKVIAAPANDALGAFFDPKTWREVFSFGPGVVAGEGAKSLKGSLGSMPGDVFSSFLKTFAVQLGVKTADAGWVAVFGEASKKDTGLPGLTFTSIRPQAAPTAWKKVEEELTKSFAKHNAYGGKVLYDFIVKALIDDAAISIEKGVDIGSTFTEANLSKLIDKFATERVKAMFKMIGKVGGEVTKTKRALDAVEANKAGLEKIAADRGLNPEKVKDIYYWFVADGREGYASGEKGSTAFWNELNAYGGIGGVDAKTFETSVMAPLMSKIDKLHADIVLTDPSKAGLITKDVLTAWILETPSQCLERSDVSAKDFVKRLGTGVVDDSNIAQTKEFSKYYSSLNTDQKAVFDDWMKNPLYYRDMDGDGKRGEMDQKKFEANYLKTKQKLAGDAVAAAGLVPADESKSFKDWLGAKDASFWNESDKQFAPSDVAAMMNAAIVIAEAYKNAPKAKAPGTKSK